MKLENYWIYMLFGLSLLVVDSTLGQQCNKFYTVQRQCLSDGPFTVECNNRQPAALDIASARLLLSRNLGSCDVGDDDDVAVCEVNGDVTDHDDVTTCTHHNCTITSVHGVDSSSRSTCTQQGYSGEDVLELSYACLPLFQSHDMAKAMSLCNDEPTWEGQLLQIDGHDLGAMLLLMDNQTASDHVWEELTVTEPNCSCSVSVEPDMEVYLRLELLELYHNQYNIPGSCRQRVEVWDRAADAAVGTFCTGDHDVIILPCVHAARDLSVYLVNEQPDDVRVVFAFRVAVSHTAKMRAVCGEERIEYNTSDQADGDGLDDKWIVFIAGMCVGVVVLLVLIVMIVVCVRNRNGNKPSKAQTSGKMTAIARLNRAGTGIVTTTTTPASPPSRGAPAAAVANGNSYTSRGPGGVGGAYDNPAYTSSHALHQSTSPPLAPPQAPTQRKHVTGVYVDGKKTKTTLFPHPDGMKPVW